jgi:hypothetical protein
MNYDFLCMQLIADVQQRGDSSSTGGLLFLTATFRQLMVLRPYEQDSWIDSTMNDHFEKKYSAKVSGKDNVDSEFAANKAVLVAASKALSDFLMTSQECEMELRVRNPRVTAHCREFMRRYMKLFSGRITLELSPLFGAGMRTLTIGCPLILQSVALLQKMKKLFDYSFLPAAEITAMLENLMSVESLCDAFIHACASDMRYWVQAISMVQPRQQGKLLKEIVQEIDSKLVLLRRYSHDLQEFAFHKLRRETIIRIVSELNVFLLRLSFDDYSDEALIDHISACRVIDKHILDIFFSWDRISDDAMSMLTTTEKEAVARPRKELLDLCDRCRGNAMRASAKCLARMADGLLDVVDLLFKETNKGNSWVGGNVCKALLARMGSWMATMTTALPNEYSVLLKAESYRFLLLLYIKKLITLYTNNKRTRLSVDGVAQVSKDLRMIETWIEETGFCAEINDLKEALKKLRQFVICEESDLLMCFSGAVQDFSYDNPDFAYDLFRLALKLRDDINPNYRRRVLGLCAEYISQFNVYRISQGMDAEELDYFTMRMSGGSFLSELLPNVGVSHCTGKKWSYETASMSEDDSVYIGNLVTETRHHIEMKKLMRKSSFAVDEEIVVEVQSNPFVSNDKEVADNAFPKESSNPFADDAPQRPAVNADKSLRASIYHLRPLEMTSMKYEHEHSGHKADINEEAMYNSVPKAHFHGTIELVLHNGFGDLHASLKPHAMYLSPFKSTSDVSEAIVGPDEDEDAGDISIQVSAEEQKRIIAACEKSSYVFMNDTDCNADGSLLTEEPVNEFLENAQPGVDRPASVDRRSTRLSSRLLIVPSLGETNPTYAVRPVSDVEPISQKHAESPSGECVSAALLEPRPAEPTDADSSVGAAVTEGSAADSADAICLSQTPEANSSVSIISPEANPTPIVAINQTDELPSGSSGGAPMHPPVPSKPQRSTSIILPPVKPPKTHRKSEVVLPVAVPCDYTSNPREGNVNVLDASAVKLILKPPKPSKPSPLSAAFSAPSSHKVSNPFADDANTSTSPPDPGAKVSNPFVDEEGEGRSSAQPVPLAPQPAAPRKSVLDILKKK